MADSTTPKGRLNRIQQQAYEIKSLAQAVYKVLVEEQEHTADGSMAGTLLCMLSSHADAIADAANALEASHAS